MATAVSVPNTFVAATLADPAPVNGNFAALVSWINSNAVHLDGSKAMTGTLSGPAGIDPVSADQYTRKAYVDALADPRVNVTAAGIGQALSSATQTALNFSVIEEENGGEWGNATTNTLTVPTGCGGTYVVSWEGACPSNTVFSALFLNGGFIAEGHESNLTIFSANRTFNGCVTMTLLAGQTLQVKAYASSGTTLGTVRLRATRITR